MDRAYSALVGGYHQWEMVVHAHMIYTEHQGKFSRLPNRTSWVPWTQLDHYLKLTECVQHTADKTKSERYKRKQLKNFAKCKIFSKSVPGGISWTNFAFAFSLPEDRDTWLRALEPRKALEYTHVYHRVA